eukprot:15462803-Alexandrium_andersonii.AAC.1
MDVAPADTSLAFSLPGDCQPAPKAKRRSRRSVSAASPRPWSGSEDARAASSFGLWHLVNLVGLIALVRLLLA